MEREVWLGLGVGAPGWLERWRELAARGRSMSDLERLGREEGAAIARFVSQQRELARRSRAKWPDGRVEFTTSVGVEQATGAAVADDRAKRFARASAEAAGRGLIAWDACGGVGGDALALLAAGVPTALTERSLTALRCAAANALALGAPAPFVAVEGDALRPPVGGRDRVLALFDPDRRDGDGARRADPEEWSPPLGALLGVAASCAGACVKLAPSAEAAARALDAARDGGGRASLEWVSERGEMKELRLWLGALADGPAEARRATGLGASAYTAAAALDARTEAPAAPADPDLDWWRGRTLLDADVALWQASLAGAHAAAADALEVAPGVARGFFVGGAGSPARAGLRAFEVLDAAALDRKRVRAMLRAHDVGPVTVKTRGRVPDADALRTRLGGPGDRPGWLAVTETAGGARVALLVRPVEAPGP